MSILFLLGKHDTPRDTPPPAEKACRSNDYEIMLARTKAHLRGATPNEIQLNVIKLSDY